MKGPRVTGSCCASLEGKATQGLAPIDQENTHEFS